MAIAVKCGCGRQFRARTEHAGRRTKCPGCYAQLLIEGEHLPDHDAFISYSSKDRLAADAVCATLEAAKVRCWMAPRDIRAGMDWGAAIIDAIGDSAVLVLLYTANSNASPQVLREIERAVSKGVTVVPLRLEEAPMSKGMEYFISASHWLDAMSPPLERHLEALAETVRALLARREVAAAEGKGAAGGRAALTSAVWDGPVESSRRKLRPLTVLWAATAMVVMVCAPLLVWLLAQSPRFGTSVTTGGPDTNPVAAMIPTTIVPPGTMPSTAPSGAAPDAPPAPHRIINLLPLIHPARDAIAGSWKVEGGRLMSDAGRFSRLRLPYAPPAEYDFVIEFTRTMGQKDVAQLFPVGTGSLFWQMGGLRDQYWGFEEVNDRAFPLKVQRWLFRDRRQRSVVRVRRDTISAELDGEMLLELPTGVAKLSNTGRWSIGAADLGLGTHESPTVFYTVQLVEVTGVGHARLPDEGLARRPGARVVNLLSLVDPAEDRVFGSWSLEHGQLVGRGSSRGILALPYTPPDEYDFRTEFTRVEGSDCISVHLVHRGRTFHYSLGGVRNSVLAFEMVGSRPSTQNPTTIRRPPVLENNRRYECVIQIRNGSVRAYLDGKLVARYETDYSDLSEEPVGIPADKMLLPKLGVWESKVAFHTVEITDVAGQGELLRAPVSSR